MLRTGYQSGNHHGQAQGFQAGRGLPFGSPVGFQFTSPLRKEVDSSRRRSRRAVGLATQSRRFVSAQGRGKGCWDRHQPPRLRPRRTEEAPLGADRSGGLVADQMPTTEGERSELM